MEPVAGTTGGNRGARFRGWRMASFSTGDTGIQEKIHMVRIPRSLGPNIQMDPETVFFSPSKKPSAPYHVLGRRSTDPHLAYWWGGV